MGVRLWYDAYMYLSRFHLFILMVLFASAAVSNAPDEGEWDKWKQGFVKKWGVREVPRSFMKKQMAPVQYSLKVRNIQKNQVTSSRKLKYKEWIEDWLDSDPPRIAHGKKMLIEHKELLDKIEDKFKVDRKAIVALWGVETTYGTHQGSYNVLESLSTLAFKARRKRFFEVQLFTALKILHQGHVTAENFLGSWSGALGQCQFMPSSFTRIAVDFDGDGKKDIWSSTPDVFASIANYLKRAKWQMGKSVGTLAYPTQNKKFQLDQYRTPAQYNKLGLRTADGKELTGSWQRKAEPIPHEDSPYVLRGSNYMSIMRWNNSSLFAALVLTLMDEF